MLFIKFEIFWYTVSNAAEFECNRSYLQYHLTQDCQGGLIQNEIICLRSYSMRAVLTGHICR